MKKPTYRVVGEDGLRRVADILGESSAAFQALRDIEARKAAGEQPICVQYGSNLVVIGTPA